MHGDGSKVRRGCRWRRACTLGGRLGGHGAVAVDAVWEYGGSLQRMVAALQEEGGKATALLSRSSWQMPRVPPAQYIGHSTWDFPFSRSFTTWLWCNHTTWHVGFTGLFSHGQQRPYPYPCQSNATAPGAGYHAVTLPLHMLWFIDH